MLVLSRKKEERIRIGDNITVTVVDIRRDKVRLGIEAPEAVPVHRQEVSDLIRQEGPVTTAEDRALKLNGEVVAWCMAIVAPGVLAPLAPAPKASLAKMLEAGRVVSEMPATVNADGSKTIHTTCEDHIVALRYALQAYGGVGGLLGALGLKIEGARAKE